MSMNATDDVVSRSATFVATVDLPEPEPPAIPIIRGFSMQIQTYSAGVWNALCARRKETRTTAQAEPYNENQIARSRARAARRRRLQNPFSRFRNRGPESADRASGRQPGIHRHGCLYVAELSARSARHCSGCQQVELYHTAEPGQRPHTSSLYRRPNWWEASVGQSGDNGSAW